MKFKWWFPFIPFVAFILTDPYFVRPMFDRVLGILGTLFVAVILLVIIQPWHTRSNDGRKL